MVARQAWIDLRSLFLAPTLSAVNELLCTMSANLVLSLLLNFAVFSPASPSRVTDVIETVRNIQYTWFTEIHLHLLTPSSK